MIYLGIDTSNYRTSAALYDTRTGAFQNESRLLDVPAGGLGLRQSDALFQHVKFLHTMIERLPCDRARIAGVGVSTRPRAVEGSYMPCFLAGVSAAHSAAKLLQTPLLECSHQQGHIAAAAFSAGRLELLGQAFLSWHLSGGTTELLYVTPGEDGLPDARKIGGTTDLSAGQLIDRAGQLLQLAFPAGAALDALSQTCSEPVRGFSPKVQDGYFSLSGVQNQIQTLHKEGKASAYIARYTIETVANAVCRASGQAVKRYRLPLLCAGGVMANTVIRARLREMADACFATPQLSGDNAVGVAVLAAFCDREKQWDRQIYTQ